MADPHDHFQLFASAGGRVALDADALLARSFGPLGILRRIVPGPQCTEGWGRNHAILMNLGRGVTVEFSTPEGDRALQVIPTGGVNFVPARFVSRYRAREVRDYALIDFTPEFTEHVLGPGAKLLGVPAFGMSDPVAEPLLRAMLAEAASGSPGSAGRMENLASALLSVLADRLALRESPFAPQGALPSHRLRKVLDYISGRLAEPLRIEELASIAGLSASHFSRAFKLATSSSPHRYVLTARLDRAKELLRSGTTPITEIATATGFATPSHFSVVFRQHFGAAPRQYREGRVTTE